MAILFFLFDLIEVREDEFFDVELILLLEDEKNGELFGEARLNIVTDIDQVCGCKFGILNHFN